MTADAVPLSDPLLTTEDLAALVRTTPSTCRYWRHMGKGPRSFKVGKRVLYRTSDVETWLARAAASDQLA